MKMAILFATATLLLLSNPLVRADDGETLLRPGDRVALLGGTLVERMQERSDLEMELQSRRPDWKMRVRNIGWSGDTISGLARKRFDDIPAGYRRLLADVKTASPNVTIVFYGQSESASGKLDREELTARLSQLVADLRHQNSRVILVTPIALTGYRSPHYRDNIAIFRESLATVAQAESVPLVQIDWQPMPSQLTADGLLLNDEGNAEFANELADALVSPADGSMTEIPGLRQLISDKDAMFFHHYRPQNETYLLLFRKHEQGNNAAELQHFLPLIDQADQAIWQSSSKAKASN